MAAPCNIYVFGDQSFDFHPRLTRLLQSRDTPVLFSFLDQAYRELRAEIGLLPAQEQAQIPRAASLADISTWDRRQLQALPCIQSALSCICHLGCVISRFETHGHAFPASDAVVSGFCTGALSAAAFSCCRTISELLPVAVAIVGVAFRVGHLTSTARKTISTSSEPWSLAVSGETADSLREALEAFSDSWRFPVTSRPYVSAELPDSFTISGPPEVLNKLRNDERFARFRTASLPIHAPYHSAHLFTDTDLEGVLQSISAGPFKLHSAHLGAVSSTDGSVTKFGDLYSRLESALKQVLMEPFRMQPLCEGLASYLKDNGADAVHIVPIDAHATSLASTLDKCLHGCTIRVLSEEDRVRPSLQNTGSASRSKIAVIGMSGRYPSAEDNREFWELLLQGRDVHKEATSLHWDVKTHVDTTGARKNTSATGFGCWLEHPEAFDAQFFNMSPREAPQVDPAQRIALMTAYEAIEQAGIVPDATPSTRKDRVGVFYGVTSNDWMETNSAQDIDTYFIPGGNRAFIPGRINYFFKFSGPSYSVDTACSSSLSAIHVACNSLWRRDIDTAIAGGTNVLTNPDFTAGLDRGHFLSRTGNCKTFDDTADGYCRGESVGTVILKRLEDAVADNDPIQALILGAYTNHSAEAESITRPHVGAQKAIFSKILSDACVDPRDVSYVEMHGTGTQAGDLGEMTSVLETFAPKRQFRVDDSPLFVGSAKANIGHGEAASGVTSLAKVLLMMRNNIIPPHCGIKVAINHKFPKDLLERNVHIADGPVEWTAANGKPRRAFVNNFSAAGGNSALLLEDKPLNCQPTVEEDLRTAHVLAITAKHASSLVRNVEAMLEFIKENQDDISLGQLSYTTTARRIHHQHRVIVTGGSVPEIQNSLRKALAKRDGVKRPPSAPNVVFAFSGQGSQYVGMGRSLYNSISTFRCLLHRLDKLAQSFFCTSFMPYFLDDRANPSQEYSPLQTQLATVAMQIALSRLWTSWGVVPDAIVGHSLGELSALNAAGVLTDAETIFVVGRRAQLLQERCTKGTHVMLAVKASMKTVELILAGVDYDVCCINGPNEVVLGGLRDQVTIVEERLKANRLPTTFIDVPYAFHTSQMDAILDDLELELQGITFRKPVVPLISTVLGDVCPSDRELDPSYLRNHCRRTVRFQAALAAAHQQKVIPPKALVVEIGAHVVLTRLVRSCLGSEVTAMPALQRDQDDWAVIADTVSQIYRSGKDLHWQEYHRFFEASHKVLQLPAYNWNLKNYWMQYVNDWSLRKGDPPLVVAAAKLQSSTIHTVHEDSAEKIVVESDLRHPELNRLIQGHVVDKIPVCTPSVYADIALQIGKYLVERYHPELDGCQLDVAEMTILKALIAKSEGRQPLQTTAEVDWAKNEARCRFVTFDAKGKPNVVHAQSVVRFCDESLWRSLQRTSADTKRRIENLRVGLESRAAERFNRTMIYKMIRPLAQFHQDYRALYEVILSSQTLEATSKVDLKDVCAEGHYHTNPAYIDGLTQSGGFTMNCNDTNDLDLEVFVNHGWASFQIFEPIDPSKMYTTYVQMFQGKDRMFRGDLLVFSEQGITASYQGICLQGVPRDVLRRILQFEAKQQAPEIVKALEVGPALQTKSPPKAANAATPEKSLKRQPAPPSSSGIATTVVSSTVTLPAYSAAESALIKILNMISEESGIDVGDLGDDITWSGIGVDSLLFLQITGRIREEIDVDMDLDDLLGRFSTVNELRNFFGSEIDVAAHPKVETTQNTVERTKGGTAPAPRPGEKRLELPTQGCASTFQEALAILSDVTGIAEEELTDEAVFTDIGVDSLMSLMLTSRLRDELELDIEDDDFWARFYTVGDLRGFLSVSSDSEETLSSPRSSSVGNTGTTTPATPATPDAMLTERSVTIKAPQDPRSVPSASSVVLQGSPRGTRTMLFLFPDGAGSATSYSSIPAVAPDVAVVGLNSPYYKDPTNFMCTIDELIDAYLVEVRRRQPMGPYHFAGWSAGGMLAYHATYRMIMSGEEMERLILIDSPVPKGLDHLPQHFYEFLSKHQVFGHATTAGTAAPPPNWLFPHFNATIDTLHNFIARPLPEGTAPKTSLIWAGQGILNGLKVELPPHPEDTEGMKFLTTKHPTFSGNGWEELFPGEKLRICVAEGADHFSMMRDHYAPKLARFIFESLI